MSMAKRLEEFLKKNRVSFQVVPHAKAYTSQGTATAEKAPASLVAKTVVVKAGNERILAVVPASYTLDLLKLEGVLGIKALKVEKEKDFSSFFPDCEVGALPPLGHLYGLKTYVDVRLTECPEIYISSGDLEEGIRIALSDYLRIAKAEIEDLVAG